MVVLLQKRWGRGRRRAPRGVLVPPGDRGGWSGRARQFGPGRSAAAHAAVRSTLGGALPSGAALQQDGGHDDQALGDVLDLGGQVVEEEDVRDRREDEDSEQGPDERPLAAAEQRPADD